MIRSKVPSWRISPNAGFSIGGFRELPLPVNRFHYPTSARIKRDWVNRRQEQSFNRVDWHQPTVESQMQNGGWSINPEFFKKLKSFTCHAAVCSCKPKSRSWRVGHRGMNGFGESLFKSLIKRKAASKWFFLQDNWPLQILYTRMRVV